MIPPVGKGSTPPSFPPNDIHASWLREIENIDNLIQDGDQGAALSLIQDLLGRMQDYKPQTPNIISAMKDIDLAQTELQDGVPGKDVLPYLEKAAATLANP